MKPLLDAFLPELAPYKICDESRRKLLTLNSYCYEKKKIEVWGYQLTVGSVLVNMIARAQSF